MSGSAVGPERRHRVSKIASIEHQHCHSRRRRRAKIQTTPASSGAGAQSTRRLVASSATRTRGCFARKRARTSATPPCSRPVGQEMRVRPCGRGNAAAAGASSRGFALSRRPKETKAPPPSGDCTVCSIISGAAGSSYWVGARLTAHSAAAVIAEPWRAMKAAHFGGEDVPLHANELRNPTTEQLDALSKFFHEQ
jgi:hypothetical protein